MIMMINRGYYMAAWGYEFYLRGAEIISQNSKIKFVSPSGHVMFCLFLFILETAK